MPARIRRWAARLRLLWGQERHNVRPLRITEIEAAGREHLDAREAIGEIALLLLCTSGDMAALGNGLVVAWWWLGGGDETLTR